ncbi:LysR family transcriptional regulator [Roseivivax halodurans]|nr:LysR family transcriptional regulator [Roseivivax halodurans]
MDWDNIRFFHAVAKAGSFSEASRRLKVSQPTVGRHIRLLEDRLDAELFHRLPSGLVLTDAGRRIFEKAEEMAFSAQGLADRIAGTRSRIEGRITLTSAEGLGQSWLIPILRDLSSHHHGLDIDVTLSNVRLDVAKGEADLALRMGEPHDESLIGRQIGSVPFKLYASRRYLEMFGHPEDILELSGHRTIESGGVIQNVPQARYLREIGARARPALKLDSLLAQKAAAEEGMGLAALPTYVAAASPSLIPVLPEKFRVSVPLWLLTRSELRRSARVGVVRSFLAGAARKGFDGIPGAIAAACSTDAASASPTGTTRL